MLSIYILLPGQAITITPITLYRAKIFLHPYNFILHVLYSKCSFSEIPRDESQIIENDSTHFINEDSLPQPCTNIHEDEYENEIPDVPFSERVKNVIDEVLEEEYPTLDEDERYHTLFQQLSPGTKFGYYAKVGEDIVNVVRKEGTRNTNHLLSSICGVMTRKQAQKLIGSSISTNRWRTARQYRRRFGPAMPNCFGKK